MSVFIVWEKFSWTPFIMGGGPLLRAILYSFTFFLTGAGQKKAETYAHLETDIEGFKTKIICFEKGSRDINL